MFFLIFLLWASFALAFPLGKLLMDAGVPPTEFIGLRMSVAGLLLLGYDFFTKRKLPGLIKLRALLLPLSRVVLCHASLNFALEYWALRHVDAVKTALIFSLSPLITAILCAWFLGESLSGNKKFAVGLGLFSGLLLLPVQAVSIDAAPAFGLPELALLASVAMSAYAWIEIKKLTQKGLGLNFINGVAMLGGGFLASVDSLIIAQRPLPWSGWSAQNFGLTMLIVASSNLLGYSLYGFLLKRYSPTALSLSGALCPIFVAMFSWPIFGGQLFSLWHLASFVTGLLALQIFYLPSKAKPKGATHDRVKDLIRAPKAGAQAPQPAPASECTNQDQLRP